ncbi:YgaP family membrane protein [Marinisporobacter balticus]|uniref:DUF2892 family protein n=1 Tax=Marinisporobacter balticus TaxID=2018667 RepID=A0A4R2L8U9_9FIRM|nr:DUF2892 domain-containing protein [Marinisporobacter balticus]TCO79148.1 DUF2892 family protein [Marinisporobacter balticus]
MKKSCRRNVGNIDRAVRIVLGSLLIAEGIFGYCIGYDLFDLSTSRCKK